MSGAGMSQEEVERFSQSKIAPDGEWWYEFSVGLYLEEVESVEMGDRRIDGICVTTRDPKPPKFLTRPETRNKRGSGWLDGEEVVIVECGRREGAWGKYGQMDVRRRMFEMDWENATVKAGILVIETGSKSGNDDTRWMFENDLDDYDYVVEYEGQYYPYSAFVREFN